jgi:hypothetical protein
MMPFYGPTPDQAARQLANWLMLAHQSGPGLQTPVLNKQTF